MCRTWASRAIGVAIGVAGVVLFSGWAVATCVAGVITPAPPVSPGAAEAAARDLALTIQVRRVLLQDSELAPLNLGVRVRNRVATLWGPVPSAEIAFKAEVCVRGVVALTELRNELFVSGDEVPSTAGGALPGPPNFLPPETPPALPVLPAGTIPPRPVAAGPAANRVTPAPPPMADEVPELPPLRLPQSPPKR